MTGSTQAWICISRESIPAGNAGDDVIIPLSELGNTNIAEDSVIFDYDGNYAAVNQVTHTDANATVIHRNSRTIVLKEGTTYEVPYGIVIMLSNNAGPGCLEINGEKYQQAILCHYNGQFYNGFGTKSYGTISFISFEPTINIIGEVLVTEFLL